jgi:hypothetical protein
MSEETISQKIVSHWHVWNESGIKVPPYRITCKEHKELLNIMGYSDKKLIASYYGIDLELVTLVEEYC